MASPDVLPADLVVLYQDAFFDLDTDKDGVILIKQLGALLRVCGENPTEADIQDMVNEIDSEASGYLQFPAFLNLMAKKYEESNAEDEIREAFRVFDSVSKRGSIAGRSRARRRVCERRPAASRPARTTVWACSSASSSSC